MVTQSKDHRTSGTVSISHFTPYNGVTLYTLLYPLNLKKKRQWIEAHLLLLLGAELLGFLEF